jgi:putative transposase
MARLARVVLPGYQHHVTQRGNRKQQTFFNHQDYRYYLHEMAKWCCHHQVEVWAYCLMPNHIHVVAVPSSEDSLARAVGETHRRYALKVNQRQGWRGHLWQERFASFVMDQTHLLAAVRYVELNPVRAGLVDRPEDYLWSSACAHLMGENDALVNVKPMLEIVGSWKKFLQVDAEESYKHLRKHEKTGRPLGSESFVAKLEGITGRILRPQRKR